MTWALGLLAFAMTVVGLTAFVFFLSWDVPEFVPPCAVVSAAGLATLGWLVSAANQRNLSRKQHTLNLLIQMRHAELYNKHLLAILKLCPSGQRPNARLLGLVFGIEKIKSDSDRDFRRGVIYILNYWEFVCAAMIVGDLDAELVKRTVRQHIVGNYTKFDAIIKRDRQSGDRLTYRHLERIAQEWMLPSDHMSDAPQDSSLTSRISARIEDARRKTGGRFRFWPFLP